MSFTKFKFWLVLLAGLGLTACGGGGSGDALLGTGTTTGTGTGTGTTASSKVSLALSSTTVTASTPAQVTATLTTSAGAAMAGQVLKFSTRDGLGSFSANSALTDANGQAKVNLAPASAATTGADTVVVTYESSGSTAVTASTGFQLTATNVTISSFVSDVSALGAYGQTTLTVNLTGTSPSAPVTVSLSSSCVTKARATLTPATVATSTGQASFTYRDQGCGAFDRVDGVQAAVVGTSLVASLQLTLTAPTASSIAFVAATPDVIYLKGTGLIENSNVTFQVRDANGLGVPNVAVDLEATTLSGGLLVDGKGAPSDFPLVRRTDADGKVTVRVNAGTVPTPVRIKAGLTLPDLSRIATVSSNLAIAVGLPAQNSFSLSQKTINIEGYNIDGISNTYTIIASDRLGNPVPAGTAVNFITESGQVQAVGFTAVNQGLASTTVNFQTASPRPTDGRVTVLAYALGEESFLDANGDNVYTPGEDFQDLGDVFLDRLFNGSFNAAQDQYISLSISGNSTCRVATSSLLQLDASAPSKTTGTGAGACDAVWGRAYVRKAAQTILSTSAARPLYGTALPANSSAVSLAACTAGQQSLINPVSGYAAGLADGYNADDSANQLAVFVMGSVNIYNVGKAGVFSFVVADANPVAMNPMAAGTTITASATSGLSVSVAGGTPVPNSSWPTGASLNFTFDDVTNSGTITVTLRSPSGLATSYAQTIYKLAALPAGQVACN